MKITFEIGGRPYSLDKNTPSNHLGKIGVATVIITLLGNYCLNSSLSHKPVEQDNKPIPVQEVKVPKRYTIEDVINFYSNQYKVDPCTVKAICHWETGFKNYEVSSEGAAGLCQLMPAAARQMGLHVPDYAKGNCINNTKTCDIKNDERFDPIKNVKVTAEYIAWIQKNYVKSESGFSRVLKTASYYHGGVLQKNHKKKTIHYANGVLGLWKKYHACHNK